MRSCLDAVVAGTGYSGPEVDVWSMGVCLYALLFGAMPFEGDTNEQLHERIIRAQLTLPAGGRVLSHACLDLLQGVLTADRLARPSLHAIEQHPWFQEASSPRGSSRHPFAESLPSSKGMFARSLIWVQTSQTVAPN